MDRHGLRADGCRDRRRQRDRRPRGRHAALQAPPRPHREGDARSLAGRRARRCARAVRARRHAAPAPQRGLPRRRLRAARTCGPRFHRRPGDLVRARCGAPPLQRRPDRSGRLGIDQRDRPAVGGAAERRGQGAHRRRQRRGRQRQHHCGLRRGRAVSAGAPGRACVRGGDHPPAGHRRRAGNDAPTDRPHRQHRAHRGRDPPDVRAVR